MSLEVGSVNDCDNVKVVFIYCSFFFYIRTIPSMN